MLFWSGSNNNNNKSFMVHQKRKFWIKKKSIFTHTNTGNEPNDDDRIIKNFAWKNFYGPSLYGPFFLGITFIAFFHFILTYLVCLYEWRSSLSIFCFVYLQKNNHKVPVAKYILLLLLFHHYHPFHSFIHSTIMIWSSLSSTENGRKETLGSKNFLWPPSNDNDGHYHHYAACHIWTLPFLFIRIIECFFSRRELTLWIGFFHQRFWFF